MKILNIISGVTIAILTSNAFADTAVKCDYTEVAQSKSWNESTAGSNVIYNGKSVASNKNILNIFEIKSNTYTDL